MNAKLNVLDLGNAVAETSLALLKRWGTYERTGGLSATWQIKTDCGSIRVFGNVLEIGSRFNSYPSECVVLRGQETTYADGRHTFVVCLIEGNPSHAAEILEKISLFLASEDFKSKIEGSIARLKKITAALE
jgi:hypothetical protein